MTTDLEALAEGVRIHRLSCESISPRRPAEEPRERDRQVRGYRLTMTLARRTPHSFVLCLSAPR